MKQVIRKMHRAFTLIEIMIVVAVIAILVGMLAAKFRGQVPQAQVATRMFDAQQLNNQLDLLTNPGGKTPPDAATTEAALEWLAKPANNSWTDPVTGQTQSIDASAFDEASERTRIAGQVVWNPSTKKFRNKGLEE